MNGKKQEFTKLVNQHTPILYRYAYWLSGSAATAHDLVQETFLRAWRAYSQLKSIESAKQWLITILRRENARRFERKRLKPTYKDVDSLESPYGNLDTRAEAFALRVALDKLSAEYREPLILQILCGYSCKEIASMLNVTPEAIMTRLYRARKQLREILVEGEQAHRSVRP